MPWRRDRLPTPVFLGFPGGSTGKVSTCNVGDPGPGGKDPPSPGPHTALLSTLPRCNPLFVRCLKPNHKKVCDGGGPLEEPSPLPMLCDLGRVALPLWTSHLPSPLRRPLHMFGPIHRLPLWALPQEPGLFAEPAGSPHLPDALGSPVVTRPRHHLTGLQALPGAVLFYYLLPPECF